jgi:hypothetical protein
MADDHDDHGHGDEDRPEYDPSNTDLPSRAPPLRSTAPQSEYTMRDVGVGLLATLVGVAVTVGLPLALV